MENEAPTVDIVAVRDAQAARLYPEPPPPIKDEAPNLAVQTVRDSDAQARTMFNPILQFGGKGHPNDAAADTSRNSAAAFVVAVNPEAKTAEIAQAATSLAHMAADVGFNRDDLNTLATFARANTAKPLTEEEHRAHKLTTIREMREEYGARYDEALAAAAALATRDPRLAKVLATNGLASNPWVVKRFAELGLAAKARGQLKVA